MLDDLILQTLRPATHDLGGFKVHRTLPHRERTTIGPFIFFDQMGPAQLPPGQGMDVRPHPHINLATVTYLFAGAIDHRDSLGTCQADRAGRRRARRLCRRGRSLARALSLEPRTLYVLRPGTGATIRSAAGAHVMLCGGAALDGPRHVWWNFVSSSRGRIRQAREDWKAGRFALPPDDRNEFIPLPDVPKTVSYP